MAKWSSSATVSATPRVHTDSKGNEKDKKTKMEEEAEKAAKRKTQEEEGSKGASGSVGPGSVPTIPVGEAAAKPKRQGWWQKR